MSFQEWSVIVKLANGVSGVNVLHRAELERWWEPEPCCTQHAVGVSHALLLLRPGGAACLQATAVNLLPSLGSPGVWGLTTVHLYQQHPLVYRHHSFCFSDIIFFPSYADHSWSRSKVENIKKQEKNKLI